MSIQGRGRTSIRDMFPGGSSMTPTAIPCVMLIQNPPPNLSWTWRTRRRCRGCDGGPLDVLSMDGEFVILMELAKRAFMTGLSTATILLPTPLSWRRTSGCGRKRKDKPMDKNTRPTVEALAAHLFMDVPKCECCGADGIPLKVYGRDNPFNGRPFEPWKLLCGLCAKTMVGVYYDNPQVHAHDMLAIMRQVSFVGNEILKVICRKGGDK